MIVKFPWDVFRIILVIVIANPVLAIFDIHLVFLLQFSTVQYFLSSKIVVEVDPWRM